MSDSTPTGDVPVEPAPVEPSTEESSTEDAESPEAEATDEGTYADDSDIEGEATFTPDAPDNVNDQTDGEGV